ncbi:MAG: hypothetical protein ACUZ8I_12950 [Candidatus Scalindua sp.]
MQVKENDSDRRDCRRLDLPLQIKLPDQIGKTINISANGVYFEVITKDLESFSPGTTIPIQITAVTATPGFEERELKFDGRGLIVRNEIKDLTSYGKRLGVAMEFKDKLNILIDSF